MKSLYRMFIVGALLVLLSSCSDPNKNTLTALDSLDAALNSVSDTQATDQKTLETIIDSIHTQNEINKYLLKRLDQIENEIKENKSKCVITKGKE